MSVDPFKQGGISCAVERNSSVSDSEGQTSVPDARGLQRTIYTRGPHSHSDISNKFRQRQRDRILLPGKKYKS